MVHWHCTVDVYSILVVKVAPLGALELAGSCVGSCGVSRLVIGSQ